MKKSLSIILSYVLFFSSFSVICFAENIPQQLIVSGSEVCDKIYDGNTEATVYIGQIEGITAGDDVTVEARGSFEDCNVGEDKCVTIEYSLVGSDAGKYSVPVIEYSTATISPREITVSVSVEDKEFDGTVTATALINQVNGIVNGDDVTVSIVNASFSDSEIGEDKEVNVYFDLTGTSASNYTLQENPISVCADIESKTVDDNHDVRPIVDFYWNIFETLVNLIKVFISLF